MTSWRRTILGARASAIVGDTYRSLADLLLSSPGTESGYKLPDNLIFFNTNGATVAYGAQPSELTVGVGAAYAAGAGVGMGYGNPDQAWDLAEVWVRNTTAGSNAVVVVQGPVYVRVED